MKIKLDHRRIAELPEDDPARLRALADYLEAGDG